VSALQQLAATWWEWIAPLSLQVTLLGGAAWLLDALLLRRAFPAVRMLLWSAVLLKLLLPPGLASPLAPLRALPAPLALAGAASAAEAPLWLPALATLWLAGCAVAVALAVRRWRALRLVLRSAMPAPPRAQAALRRAAGTLGLRRPPRLLLADLGGGPAVAGVLRPVVLLPRGECGRPARELYHVLLHELAHVRRRDPLAAAACEAARALFWFHPLVRLAAHRVAVLRELCCDAAVADRLRAATPRYRATLLAEAGRRLLPAASPALRWRGGAPVLQRLAALARPSWQRRGLRRASCTFTACALACVLPMGRGADARLSSALVAADAARAVLADAAAGGRPGCLRLHHAAFILLADGQPVTASASARRDP
jgi:beta-lactamase regulating signal transducer with metallopeptidase domain